MAKQIPLVGKHGKGKFAIVSDEDYERLSKWSWTLLKTGYAHGTRRVRTGVMLNATMHSLVKRTPDGMVLDHMNGDRLDNRRENLFVCDQQHNTRNRAKNRRECSSKYVGVYRHSSGKWLANITVDGKYIALGLFDTEVGAAYARDLATMEYFGDKCRLNGVNADDVPTDDRLRAERKALGYRKKLGSKSVHKGIHTIDNGWVSRLRHERRSCYLGYYRLEIEAAYAWNVAVVAYRPNERLNDIPDDAITPERRSEIESLVRSKLEAKGLC